MILLGGFFSSLTLSQNVAELEATNINKTTAISSWHQLFQQHHVWKWSRARENALDAFFSLKQNAPSLLYIIISRIPQLCKAGALYMWLHIKRESPTWIDGFIVSRREMPRPSNASLHVKSEKVFQSPLDLPNSLVCILDDAVSKGCIYAFDIRLLKKIKWNRSIHSWR